MEKFTSTHEIKNNYSALLDRDSSLWGTLRNLEYDFKNKAELIQFLTKKIKECEEKDINPSLKLYYKFKNWAKEAKRNTKTEKDAIKSQYTGKEKDERLKKVTIECKECVAYNMAQAACVISDVRQCQHNIGVCQYKIDTFSKAQCVEELPQYQQALKEWKEVKAAIDICESTEKQK